MAITKLSKVEPNISEQEESDAKPIKRNFCKRFAKFLFSHIGLVLIVIIWSVIGAFLFVLLEQHEEIKNCETGKGQESTNIVTLRSQLLTYIQFNITSNPSDLTKDNETVANNKIEAMLQNFRANCYNNMQTNYYYGQDCAYPKWNFTQSLLFAITAITTIGKLSFV